MRKLFSIAMISSALLVGCANPSQASDSSSTKETSQKMSISPNLQGCYQIAVDSGAIYKIEKNKLKYSPGDGYGKGNGKILSVKKNTNQEFSALIELFIYELDFDEMEKQKDVVYKFKSKEKRHFSITKADKDQIILINGSRANQFQCDR